MNVSLLFAFSCAFDFDLRVAPCKGALTIDDPHKTDMWNWCSLRRLFLLLKLLLFSILSGLQYGHRCLSRLLFGHR
ncbi:uncharacterized protein P174DRAFT_227450 [Aspergillus novofumigatus IBT 16806]|uniref:Uncharacterized protein n=1 Tax=Aspergillus novofumigatus (strain IBT 16806) TaxID=1392255 RepID=A0A2I1C6R4_ASPN1|nr:uncharacterized protein P174DRAFT_227450 [Aspergillus novofumigatus IBT 16806]PKX93271.1 hypothetical protein P174DRAFT_227450 [Aspergillus novofumigatus IBT 16806]